ncbi:vanadium-dependent haloperoxidase [Thermomonospora umbrina]|uniref:PAP2 superfamily protein n=1 Tax=Thermomonospora umbrina TaxID=111806 RepID=A0A3D9SUR5_9ACTN|nr:vanadium-dependent haloperoxidase [Thermomonospora umbrina]REE99337.1 PAP2 superfamily protein [Thermomonospora umbrina]
MRAIRSLALFVCTLCLAALAAVGVVPAAAATTAFDPALYWNGVLLDTYRQVGGAPGPLARTAAMMHGVIYEAHVLANPYSCGDDKLRPNKVAASAEAAYQVLRAVYPAIDFADERDHALSQVPATEAGLVTFSREVARCISDVMLTRRAQDGGAFDPSYTVGTRPGDWRETGSGSAATPKWGTLPPFCLTSGSQFRPGLPGGVTSLDGLLRSRRYADAVNEVKRLGRRDASAQDRTAEQTEIAFFWANDLDGTYKPPGQHLDHTRQVSVDRGLTPQQNARLFALVSYALADAAVTAWNTKYDSDVDLWRPESAIALAGTDGNPATEPESGWRPLSQNRAGVSFSPPFPAYVSGHATLAGAWAGAMRRYFGTDAISFVGGTDDPKAVGVTRRFTSFSQAAREDADSRIYLGVHYRFDADNGLSSGENVAGHVFDNCVRLT